MRWRSRSSVGPCPVRRAARADRLGEVRAVISRRLPDGYLSSERQPPAPDDRTVEAEWLASLLARLMPLEPEVLGPLALIRLHRARAEARFDADGRLVLL